MNKQVIHTDKAPKAIGPYSQAIHIGSMIYTAGQVGLDPSTMELVEGGVEEQTRQVLANLTNVLEAAGTSISKVIKTTVFLTTMDNFAKVNTIYAEVFNENPPARTTVAVSSLPKNALVEIECVALV